MSDPKPTGWKCDLGNGEFDHDLEEIHDWFGDPDVTNGTFDFAYWRCRVCGAEGHEDPRDDRKVKP